MAHAKAVSGRADPAGTCTPAAYAENCVPFDADTSACLPSGDRQIGQSCWLEPCVPGGFCSLIDGTCYELCDPAGPDTCATGLCHLQVIDGVDWFGLCY